MNDANEVIDVVDVSDQGSRQRTLRLVGHISYFLHAIVAIGAVLPGFQPSVLLLLVAFVMDLVKRNEAVGTWQESHFRWRIRSVLWAGGLYVLTIPLWFLLVIPGMVAWVIISVWFLYRVVRGWMALNAGRPMPA